jgi:transcription elongation factor GreA
MSIQLTQSAYDKLQEELDYLKTVKRDEITKKVAEAREEGDLKENGGYHAAREEQGKNEGKIAELQEKLDSAEIISVSNSKKISPFTVIKMKKNGETLKFLLASRDLVGSTPLTVYSPESPLGAALLGHKKGDIVEYVTPSGKVISIEILEVKPFRE